MIFKTPAMEEQWKDAHPELRDVIGVLEAQLVAWGYPPICVTEVDRTKAENFAIYFQRELADGLTESHARWRAERQFSYHFCGCAVDFRSSGDPYNAGQRERIFWWLRKRCPVGPWGLLFHDTGSGLHFHLERKDGARRKAWEAGQGAV